MGAGLPLVTCTPEPPRTWYIHNSKVRCAQPVRETMTYSPSGVHAGDANSELLSLESFFGSLPPAFMIHRFSAPSRSERKAIHIPSGEKRGWLSKAIVLLSFC